MYSSNPDRFEPRRFISSVHKYYPEKIHRDIMKKHKLGAYGINLSFAMYTLFAIPEIINFIDYPNKYPGVDKNNIEMTKNLNYIRLMSLYLTGISDAKYQSECRKFNRNTPFSTLVNLMNLVPNATKCRANVIDGAVHVLDQWEREAYDKWIIFLRTNFSITISLFGIFEVNYTNEINRTANVTTHLEVLYNEKFFSNIEQSIIGQLERKKIFFLRLPKYLLMKINHENQKDKSHCNINRKIIPSQIQYIIFANWERAHRRPTKHDDIDIEKFREKHLSLRKGQEEQFKKQL